MINLCLDDLLELFSFVFALFFKPGTNKESLETKGPYPLVKLFVNVNFFFLNKQKPLIRRERSFK